MILRGRYVSLYPLSPDDAEVTQKWRTSGRAFLLNPGAQSVEEQRAWIESRPPDEYNFVMVLECGQPVGMLSLIDVDPVARSAQTSHFLIGEPEAVKGLPVAAEAMKLVYDLAFDTLGLTRIWGWVRTDNRGMIVWQKYLGMREEGHITDHGHEAVILGLSEADYRRVTVPKINALIGANR